MNAPQPPANVEMPPIVPRSVLFGNPQRIHPQLSPDGKYLAYLAPDDRDVLQVWVRTVGKADDRLLTSDRKRGIRSFRWTYSRDRLLYSQDSDGDENFHLYLVDTNTRQVRDITPFPGVQARFLALEPEFPDEIRVELNLENRQQFDVYRLDMETGELDLDTKNLGTVSSWKADKQLNIRAAIATQSDGGSDLLVRETVDSPWDIWRHWEPDDNGYISHFSADGNILYLIDNYEANTKHLVALDIKTREETVIATDDRYDLDRVFVHPVTRKVQAVGIYRDKLEWQVLDEDIAPDFEILQQLRRGEFSVVSRDLEDTTWLVAYVTDDGPVYYYTYDRATQTPKLLFSHRPELEDLPLVPMEAIAFESRDGLTIEGYLTLPTGGETPVPTVLLVHGGPWSRDTWGYNSRVQWLANRGYAVLQVNFRGSEGYGKAFLNAGNREWAAKMHDDLIDAVEWIVIQGISDRHRIAIMGTSYGGYAALVGLTFTPEVFACGVDIVGPSNLITLLRTIPPYWSSRLAIFYHRMGNLETEEEFLRSRSPLFFCDRIQKPLLIGQGANDPRVKQAESEQIVEAMKQAGKPVEYVLYTDEGHGFVRPPNRLHFYAIVEEFLSRHLGGQYEPMGNIIGHSGIVRQLY